MSYTHEIVHEFISPHGSRVILEQPVRGGEVEVWRLTQSGRGRFKVRTLHAIRSIALANQYLMDEGYEPVEAER